MLKSRSTPGNDKITFKACEEELDSKFTKVSSVDIGKWAKGHMAYYVE